MAQTLIKTIADYSTTLVSKTAVGATTATLTSGLDSDGVQLPTGTYGFTIDRNNSAKEHFTATLTGANLTSIQTVTRGTGAGTSGLLRVHRKGAEVIISDHVAIKRMMNVLDGTTDLDASTPLKYDGVASLTPASNELASVAYVDGVSIAGAADATTTTKGISEEATEAEIDAGTGAGGTSARLFVNPSTLATSIYGTQLPTAGEKAGLPGNNTDIAVGSGNKYVTQTGLQDGAEVYGASTTGNDTYVVTLSPVPAGLHDGMTIRFKPGTANTGAATLNVNSLGALAIVTGLSTALVTGDILANQVCEVVYNSTGTVWQLVNPASAYLSTPTYTNGTTTYDASTASGTQNIAHGGGKIPKKIKITAMCVSANTPYNTAIAETVYNGTTQSSVSKHSVSAGGTVVAAFVLNCDGTATNTATGVTTFDATNIIITWTKASSPVGTFTLMWEAEF